jgi:hypothetical protein
MNKLQAERRAKGLCTQCGADAAPYTLCVTHRQVNLMRRVTNRLAERGYALKEHRGRENVYSRNPAAPPLTETVYREAQEGDARLHPRLHHVPVDIEQTLRALFAHLKGGPVTEEEILSAWHHLRVRPGRVSAAQDMATLILADRKRRARAQMRQPTRKENAHG